eukprot:12090851-Heterocapsa_arctica.AAC.1
MALWGYAYVQDIDVSSKAFPRAHRALKGWNRAAPQTAGNPQPWELALATSDILAGEGVRQLGPWALHAARAVPF